MIDLAVKLADYIVGHKDPEMRWTWGQGIMGAALNDLDLYLGSEKYLSFLRAFCDHYVKNEPSVNSADTAAPGFISYAVWKRTDQPEYKALTDKVLDYIKNEPRVYKDAVNHLGSNPVPDTFRRLGVLVGKSKDEVEGRKELLMNFKFTEDMIDN